MKLEMTFAAAIASLAFAALPAAGSLPVPVYPSAEKDSATAFDFTKNSGEFSVAFWAKFNSLPSGGSPTGLFGCSAGKDGIVTFRLPAGPLEFQGDCVVKSKDAVGSNEWHHFELSYSLQQKRVALYIDGRFQWENDNLFLPRLALGGETAPVDFTGEVKDLVFYDYALENAYLTPADRPQEAIASVKAIAEKAKSVAVPTALKGWASEIAAACDKLLEEPARVTSGILRDVERDARNALEIATASTNSVLSRATKGFAALYSVKPLAQEPYLPYSIPKNGEITSEMRVVASPGEYENGSVLVFAYKPLTVSAVSVSDLRSPGGKVIPSSEVDVKLVKRWFRTGGAWLSYHSDRRQRNLTPDLLINDDSLIKVDELRRKNYLRLDYPEGTRYVDVSDPAAGHTSWDNSIPFQDSDKMKPHQIPEAGRSQQYMLTFHAPSDAEPGIYRGSISFSIPGGGDVSMEIAFCVLPIALPTEPSPYSRLDKVYISHMNSLPAVYGASIKEREENVKKELANIRAHNLFHTTGIWNTPELAGFALKAGFVPDKIFADKNPRSWRDFFPTVPAGELTLKDKEAGTRAAVRENSAWHEFLKKTFPDTAEHYVLYHSESLRYDTLVNVQAEEAYVAHKLGYKVFAHTMNDRDALFMGDIQDMTSSTAISADEAKLWRAAGGELINYCDPFPGSENPEWFRRKVGFLMYKRGLDGQMLHEFRQIRVPWNEFAEDFGGDGNYRNFCMAYPMRNGSIYTIAWEGMREAYDDLRYATRLCQLASANLNSESEPLRREAKRAMIWLEKQNGQSASLDMLRMAIINRILILQDTIAKFNGTLPDADMSVRR